MAINMYQIYKGTMYICVNRCQSSFSRKKCKSCERVHHVLKELFFEARGNLYTEMMFYIFRR